MYRQLFKTNLRSTQSQIQKFSKTQFLNSKIVTITPENFDKEIVESKTPVLVDCYADWCGPCKMLTPVLQNIASKNSNIKITKIDVDQHNDLIEDKFPNQSVQSIPYVIGVVNGKAVNHFVGLLSEEKINEFIKTLKE
eukprot:gene211-4457_t